MSWYIDRAVKKLQATFIPNKDCMLAPEYNETCAFCCEKENWECINAYQDNGGWSYTYQCKTLADDGAICANAKTRFVATEDEIEFDNESEIE